MEPPTTTYTDFPWHRSLFCWKSSKIDVIVSKILQDFSLANQVEWSPDPPSVNLVSNKTNPLDPPLINSEVSNKTNQVNSDRLVSKKSPDSELLRHNFLGDFHFLWPKIRFSFGILIWPKIRLNPIRDGSNYGPNHSTNKTKLPILVEIHEHSTRIDLSNRFQLGQH